jgi:hypothetical protein
LLDREERVLGKTEILKLRDIMDAKKEALECELRWCDVRLKISQDIIREIKQGNREGTPSKIKKMKQDNKERRSKLRKLREELKKTTDVLTRIGKLLLVNFREDVFSSIYASRSFAVVISAPSRRVSEIRREG